MSHTYEEIKRQPADWRLTLSLLQEREQDEAIRSFFEAGNFTGIVFTGCGTSYYLALCAASFFQEKTGILARAFPASDVMLNAANLSISGGRELLVAFSRSGSTSETVEALKAYRKSNCGLTMSITVKPDSPAGLHADLSVVLPHATERSLVMTTSFTNMLLAAQWLAAAVAADSSSQLALRQLPDMAEGMMTASENMARSIGSDLTIEQVIYLGQAAYYGAAQEAVLKLKEMTQAPSEAYNPFEFRHGPISIVNPRTLTVLLAGSRRAEMQVEVLRDVRQLGGRTLLVGPRGLRQAEEDTLTWDCAVEDAERILLCMPFVQLVGCFRAMAVGKDPDRPRYLNAVVYLKV